MKREERGGEIFEQREVGEATYLYFLGAAWQGLAISHRGLQSVSLTRKAVSNKQSLTANEC